MRRQLVCLPRLHLWFIDSHLASPQARLVAGHDRSGGGATEVNVVDTRSAGHSAADRSTVATVLSHRLLCEHF